LKFLFWSVYDSRLYTASGEYSEGERPLRLEIEYLLDVKAEALLERTLSEWESMGRSHPHQQQWRQELSGIWTDIKSGDVLSLELDSEHRSTFRRNGEVLGRIEDPEFGQEFVDIWLSEDCTRPEIRLALLGKKSA
ncbi:MAG: chalcone isomerase family protein, partial [Congregibacter sp.]|nr:chalcone isomerase family protein [Congregibacter sp.]